MKRNRILHPSRPFQVSARLSLEERRALLKAHRYVKSYCGTDTPLAETLRYLIRNWESRQ